MLWYIVGYYANTLKGWDSSHRSTVAGCKGYIAVGWKRGRRVVESRAGDRGRILALEDMRKRVVEKRTAGEYISE